MTLLQLNLPNWLHEQLPSHLRIQALLMLLASGTCSLLCLLITPLDLLEARLYDLRTLFSRPEGHHGELVLVQIGHTQGQDLLDFLERLPPSGPRAVGLDIPSLLERPLSVKLASLSARKRLPIVLGAHGEWNTHGQLTKIRRLHNQSIREGFAHYPADRDGVIRKQPLNLFYRKAAHEAPRHLPSFAYALYQELYPNQSLDASHSYFAYASTHGGHNPQNIQLLTQNPNKLNGKVILIAERGLEERGITPFQNTPLRLELHAYALEGLLENRLYERPVLLNQLIALGLSVLGLITLWLTLKWGGLISILSLLSLWLSYITINLMAFRYLNLWLDLTQPSLSLWAGAACVMLFFQKTEGQTRKELYSTFRRHLPDQKVRALMEQQGDVLTQNERRVVTVMFTDIQGFSRMGEKLPPDQIIHILNEYFEAMTEIIFSNQGTLDKYIGDGIMAVYGNIGNNNPKEDAYYAVKTALEMQLKMVELQRKWMKEGIRPIQIRIGINTGESLVGHVGHPKRKELTVIGDTVNTTARIEKLNKQYRTHILISHSTYEYVKERTEVRPLGEEQLKGKSDSVMVYEVKGWKKAQTA